MKYLSYVGGILTAMVGLGFVCPQLAQMRVGQDVGIAGVLLLSLGVVLMLGGGSVIVRGIRRQLIQS